MAIVGGFKLKKNANFFSIFFISYQKIPLVFLLENIIYFNFLHRIEVKFESFKNQEKSVRHSLDAASFQSVYFFLAFFTVICIVSFKHFSLNIEFKTFFNRTFVLYLEHHIAEELFSLGYVRTSFANKFIRQNTLK